MPDGDPRERFVASLVEAKVKPRKQRKLTLKSIVAENLTEIIQSCEEDGLDLGEIAAKLAAAYGVEINDTVVQDDRVVTQNPQSHSKDFDQWERRPAPRAYAYRGYDHSAQLVRQADGQRRDDPGG